MDAERVRDPEQIARYVETVRRIYGEMNVPVDFADPPTVFKTATGAKIAVWLTIEDEDLQA